MEMVWKPEGWRWCRMINCTGILSGGWGRRGGGGREGFNLNGGCLPYMLCCKGHDSALASTSGCA